LQFAPVGGEDKEHIAEKPLEIIETLVGVSSVGSTVVDCFMGSGTTGVACVRTGRKFVGVELEPRYFDIACRRIEQAYAQGRLFEPEATKPEQASLLDGE
jgi:DNA modification methylase